VHAVSGGEGDMDELQEFRARIDDLDGRLLDVLARRFEVCREIAAHKGAAHVPMMQPGRVAEVKRRAIENGRARGLAEAFLASLYDLVIAEACRIEDEILGAAGESAE